MGRIKGWKTTKYKSRNYTMWKNILPKYESFEDNYTVTIGREGRTKNFFMWVIKEGRQLISLTYDNFEEAKKIAIDYMKKHPRG